MVGAGTRTSGRARQQGSPALATVPAAVALLVVAALAPVFAACGRAALGDAAEPVVVPVADLDEPAFEPDTAGAGEVDAGAPAAGAGDAATGAPGGGLRVLSADGALVGVLIGRGHPFQATAGAAAGATDVLRDSVMVYHPGARLFFGVAMASGAVLSPRLGIADNECKTPVVAGYYTDGPEISGYDMAFVWAGAWWRIRGGEPLQLVGCAGMATGGANAKCVPHSGSCRGFPVEKIGQALPTSFAAPLRFDWLGAGG